MSRLVWTNKFFQIGYQRKLENLDIYNVLPEDSSIKLSSELSRQWEKELYKWRTGGSPSLLRALLRCYAATVFGLSGILLLIEESLRITQTVLLGYILSYFEQSSNLSKLEAYLYVTAFCFAYILSSLIDHPAFHNSYIRGLQMKVACSSLIYRKVFRLSNYALGQTATEEIVNLMSSDVHKFNLSVIAVNYLWIGPIEALVVGWLLWQQVGVSCLPGLGLLLLLVPLQLGMGKLFATLRCRINTFTDRRLQLLNEMISNLRLVKLVCWEVPITRLINSVRRMELSLIGQTSLCRGLNAAFFFTSGKLVMFCTFTTFVFLGNTLTAKKVFVCYAMYELLRTSLSLLVPWGLQYGSEALGAIKKIEKFLLMQEKLPQVPNISTDTPPLENMAVVFKDYTASWSQNPGPTTLTGLSFGAHKAQLTIVTGPSGSGKTSLLMSILGEMGRLGGFQYIHGRTSFSAQDPWVFSGTIRENIVFGEHFDRRKYNRVIQACALSKDFSHFPDGDFTVVGDKGVTLDTGQKVKLNLARAVYHEADIYLIDDSFNNFDAKTARHLFNKCINHLLGNKTVIFVTNQLQFIKLADNVLVLSGGTVQLQGKPSDIVNEGRDLEKLLAECGTVEGDRDAIIEDALDIVDGTVKLNEMKKRFPSQTSIESEDSLNIEIVDLKGSTESLTEKLLEEPIQDLSVDWHVYWQYFTMGGGILGLLTFSILWVAAQVAYVLNDWWLAHWSLQYQRHNLSTAVNSSHVISQPVQLVDINTNFYIYCSLTGGLLVLSIIACLLFFAMTTRASQKIHRKIFEAVLGASMDVVESTPRATFLHCFSQDVSAIDGYLPTSFFDAVQCLSLITSSLLIAACVNYWTILLTIPIIVLFLYTRHYYIQTVRDIRRIEANSRSPVYSHLSSTLQGVWTIRALNSEERFLRNFDVYQDRHTAACYISLATNRWFALRLEILCTIFVLTVCYGAMIVTEFYDIEAGLIGLSLTYAMSMMGLFQWSVRQSADVETQMTSVERSLSYSGIKPEPYIPKKITPAPSGWPQYGIITYEGVSVKYGQDAPKALRNIWCCIRAQEKVGIVGRPGAGKTTLINALLRMVDPYGIIRIDGINICEVPLHNLRDKVAVIPQQAILFSGTLRVNLDPYSTFTDAQIWKTLEEVQLKTKVFNLPDQLYTEVSAENDAGFNLGERQLLCIARALLKNARIMITEEAASNIDPRTNALVQQTVKNSFKKCTVITIAHRLKTIIDYDRVMVLDGGRIIEFDTPYELLLNRMGLFYRMVEQSGEDWATLMEIAQHKYENKPYRSPSLETLLSTEVNMNYPASRSPGHFLPSFQTLRLTRTISHLSAGGNRFSVN